MISSTPTFGFVAVGAAVFGPVPPSGNNRAVVPHTNQYQLGNMDSQGCFCPCKLPTGKDAKWTVNNPGNGKANVDLGNYELQLDEKNSQIKIVNKQNGEVTNIWGDPHIDWNKDGKTDADFWGKTTFQLEDGTKITIDTEPWKGGKDMYVASEVTVTRGDHAMKISGISQNELGDLQVEYADRGGQALDWAVTDGFTVHENAKGEGWVNPDTGKLATQEDFNITKPGVTKPYEFTQEFGQALGLFLATGLFGGGLDLGGSSSWTSGRSEYSSVIAYKPGMRAEVRQRDDNTLTIHHRNGSVDTRSGGSLAWRANNPGLLPYNALTRSLGAIGQVDGVAVFATEDKGRNALAQLLLGALR